MACKNQKKVVSAYAGSSANSSKSTLKLLEKLEKKEKILAAFFGQVAAPSLARYIATSGADMVIVDLEHGAFNPESVSDFAVACNEQNFPVIARIQDCEYHCISKCIDQGCDGILVPRVETMEQVETAISSMRLPPYGKKGVGGRACLRGDSVEEFNRKRLIFIQMESPQGADLLDEILTKYGDEIAGVIVGPADMSFACECPLNFEGEKFVATVKKVIAVSKAHDKSVGMYMESVPMCKRWFDEGMNIFWPGSEGGYIKGGLMQLTDEISKF